MDVEIGVDAHKRSFDAAVVDGVGRNLGTRQFANTAQGHAAALAWMRSHGDRRVIGIEGAHSYGAGLARMLAAAGESVFEVPASLTPRERRKTPSRGKSDPADALAIARIVARREGLCGFVVNAVCDELKVLSDHRDDLVARRTQVVNRVHAGLSVVLPGYERDVPTLKAKRHRAAARRLVDGLRGARAELVRDQLDELEQLDARVAVATAKLKSAVKASGTTLTELHGIGFVLAARILGEVGDLTRIRSQAAFAMLNGTAPLQASSGATQRHRLNRGGNRQLNRALHVMAVVRLRCDADTKAYFARRRSQGKSAKEAMRALKRHLSNVAFRCMVADIRAGALAT